MKFSKTLFAGVLSLALVGTWSFAEDAKATKTVKGKSSCAQCDGIPTSKKHEIMVVDKDGMRWVLLADKDSQGYKEAHKVRKDGKTISAKLAGEPKVQKDENGKEYKEVKVSEVKVEDAA
jgi:hypothetical protein